MDSLVHARPSSPPPPRPASAVLLMPTSKPSSIVAVFETEESGLLRYAIGLTGRRAAAEEIVQEAFLRLHRDWTDVENPRAWLYRSVRNLALNHLRDRKPDAELTEATVASDDTPPADVLGRHEAVGLMRLALAEIPAEDQRLLRLKYHDDLPYQEISKQTGLSVGNVGYRLHHILKHLATTLRSAGLEGSQG